MKHNQINTDIQVSINLHREIYKVHINPIRKTNGLNTNLEQVIFNTEKPKPVRKLSEKKLVLVGTAYMSHVVTLSKVCIYHKQS